MLSNRFRHQIFIIKQVYINLFINKPTKTMKRTIVLLAVSAIMISANAQDQGRKNLDESNKSRGYSVERLDLWSTDVNFNLFGNNYNNFKMTELNLRRYLDDCTALRLSVGFGMDNTKKLSNNDNEDPNLDYNKTYSISHSETKTTSSQKSFNIGIGYERHADIFDKVDVFYGAELGYSGMFYTAKTQTDSKSVNQYVYTSSYSRTETTRTYEKKYFKSDDSGNMNSNGFYATAFAGVDVFIYKNIYLGTELGLKYDNSHSKNGYYTENDKRVTKYFEGTSQNLSSLSEKVETTSEFSSKDGVGNNTRKSEPYSTSDYDNDYYNAVSSIKSVGNNINLFIDPSFHIGIRF